MAASGKGSGRWVVPGMAFCKSETRYFRDHVVDRWLERRRHRTAGDVVPEFVQRITHREFGSHLGNRKSGRFRSQRGGTGHSRIHFDDQHAAILWINRKLNVGAASFHPDLAQYRDRCVAHDLIFLVGKRLRGRAR